MRLRETANGYGTPVVEYRCETCGETFTICPAPEPEKDGQWTGCMAPTCGSYDPTRDADKLFDDGDVLSFERRKNPGCVIRRPAKPEAA
jgi:DNA-directed RNA polymerase subunit RPC12/RpoP